MGTIGRLTVVPGEGDSSRDRHSSPAGEDRQPADPVRYRRETGLRTDTDRRTAASGSPIR